MPTKNQVINRCPRFTYLPSSINEVIKDGVEVWHDANKKPTNQLILTNN